MSTGPTMNRHNSEQDVETPDDFIVAVERRFGPLELDLAATQLNKKAPVCFTPEDNSLSKNWHIYKALSWLNPPFGDIEVWAHKCAEEWLLGAEILLLVPASVGANWWWDWVEPFTNRYSIGRLKFVGHKDVYPKDLMLCHYDRKVPRVPEMQRWPWRKEIIEQRRLTATTRQV